MVFTEYSPGKLFFGSPLLYDLDAERDQFKFKGIIVNKGWVSFLLVKQLNKEGDTEQIFCWFLV